jgi:hypothetical protein
LNIDSQRLLNGLVEPRRLASDNVLGMLEPLGQAGSFTRRLLNLRSKMFEFAR